MVGRRTAAVIGLAALLFTGASLLGPVGAEASARPGAPDDKGAFDRSRDSYDRMHDRMHDGKCDHPRDHDGASASADDKADDKSGTFGGTPAPVTGQSPGEPSVGGAQATTDGADGKALVASTAPTPPNGAEPPAAASPGVADTSPVESDTPVDAPVDAPVDTPVEAAPVPAATAPAPDGGLLDDLDDVIGAIGPNPVAAGLSPDTTRPGVLVALLAFAVLLFLLGYQLVDRRDPRRDATRDAEAVARFR